MWGRRASTSVMPETMDGSEATVGSIVQAALDALRDDTEKTAAPMVLRFSDAGIRHAWQLAALRDEELKTIVCSTAGSASEGRGGGWNTGELMALRLAIAGRGPAQLPTSPAGAPQRTSDAQSESVLHQLLSFPASSAKGGIRAFAKGSRKGGLWGFMAPLLAMPARQAKDALMVLSAHTSNSAAILAFVMWQFRVSDSEVATSYGALSQIMNFVIALGVLVNLFALASSSALVSFLGLVPGEILEAHVSALEAAAQYACFATEIAAAGQYLIVAVVVLSAWHSLMLWYAVALTAVLALIWAKTTPLDSLLVSGLHPIGLLHAPRAFVSSLGVSVNDALLDRAKAHAQTLLALAARARTTAES